MYEVFCFLLLLLGFILLFRGAVLMVQVVIRKKEDKEMDTAFKFIIASVIVTSLVGYLISHPPLELHTIALIGKLFLTVMLIITLHEAGHLIVARLLKIPILEFSVGLGPVLYKIQLRETLYQIKLMPIGGYVKAIPESVATLSLIQKCSFFLAGIFVNIVCFIIGLSVFFVQNGKDFLVGLLAALYEVPNIFQRFYAILLQLKITDVITPERDLENTIGVYISFASFVEHFWLGFAVLSLLLALINTIPIPILDGGQVMVACLESFLKFLKVPGKIINYMVVSLFVSGVGIYYIPTIINNLWSNSEKLGVEFVEYLLWLALVVSILMNVSVYFENKYEKPVND